MAESQPERLSNGLAMCSDCSVRHAVEDDMCADHVRVDWLPGNDFTEVKRRTFESGSSFCSACSVSISNRRAR